MAFTSVDLDALDRAIASGTLAVRFADGRSVNYRTMEELLKARAFIASQLGEAADPANTPGAATYAEWESF